MTSFLLAAAVLVLGMVAIALARLLHGRQPLDWVMAAQLLGTAGIAALLLLGAATAASGALDIALLLALLAAFATLAFAASAQSRAGAGHGRRSPSAGTGPEDAFGADTARAGNGRRPPPGTPGGHSEREQ